MCNSERTRWELNSPGLSACVSMGVARVSGAEFRVFAQLRVAGHLAARPVVGAIHRV